MIRKAVFGDIDGIAVVFRQLHQRHVEIAPDNYKMPFEGYYRTRLETFFADDDITILVSENEGIDGFAVIRFFDTGSAERVERQVCYVECFAVEESRRGRGIGTALFGYIKDYALNCGCDCIRLGAAAGNTQALNFYEKMGLVPRVINLRQHRTKTIYWILYASCLHIFRHIAQKLLDGRQPACVVFVQSDEKSDGAICAQSLCGIALTLNLQ